MDWFAQIFVFGLAALILFILSMLCTARKQYMAGLAFGVLELVAAAVSSWAWADALRNSGKGDWFLLGLLGYTPIALVFWAMFVVGILCMVWSVAERKHQSGPAMEN